jgi:hypothetical protein
MPILINPDLYCTVGTAARLADVSRHWMRLQAAAGKIMAVQIDGQWFVLRSAAERFERHPTAGRPRASTIRKPRKPRK